MVFKCLMKFKMESNKRFKFFQILKTQKMLSMVMKKSASLSIFKTIIIKFLSRFVRKFGQIIFYNWFEHLIFFASFAAGFQSNCPSALSISVFGVCVTGFPIRKFFFGRQTGTTFTFAGRWIESVRHMLLAALSRSNREWAKKPQPTKNTMSRAWLAGWLGAMK